ncbi:MAG: hypothetical protein RLZZ299_2460 [Pseudomonadota bacterium]
MSRRSRRLPAGTRWGWGLLFACWADPARALTLDEAVRAVEDVHPDAVVAELQAARAHAEALGAAAAAVGAVRWEGAAPMPEAAPWQDAVTATVRLADPARVLAALERGAAARTRDAVAGATRFEAGYAAARLYVDAVAAEADLSATLLGEARARATLEATGARVDAGLEAGLAAGSARLGLLEAEAARVRAEAARTVARDRLARALQRALPEDEPLAAVSLPWGPPDAWPGEAEAGSPWLGVARAGVGEARAGELRAWGGLLPRATLQARRAWRTGAPWQVGLDVRWDLPGVVGPLAGVRAGVLGRRVAEVRLDGLARDLALAARVARAEARAAAAELAVAEARASLAEEALGAGQARLAAGLAGPLEVLRVQDDAARARRARVEAERRVWLARLEAARVAGRAWSWTVAARDGAPSLSCGETPCVPR